MSAAGFAMESDAYHMSESACVRIKYAKPAGLFALAPAQAREERLHELIEDIYALSEQKRPCEATDLAVDYLDDQLLAGEFSACDRFFELANPARLSPAIQASVLMITKRASGYLPNRDDFYLRAIRSTAKQSDAAPPRDVLGKYR